jgi:2-hydroxy-6-oxonona-2,4-dienedioate hydrolase
MLEAKLAFVIKSLSSEVPYNINDIGNTDILKGLSYEDRKKITDIEDEMRFAKRVRLNLESLRQMGLTSYSTPQRFTNINNNIIRYLDYGPTDSNNILILIHGLGGSAERWSYIVPPLLKTRKDLRVIIPDIIGFGYSDKPHDVQYTMDFFIDDFFIPFLDNIGISSSKAISIVGSSFGGHLATEFAIRFNDRVEKLVLVSPAGMMRKSNPTLKKYANAALDPKLKYRQIYAALKKMVYDPRVVNEEMVLDFMNKMRLPNAQYAFLSTLVNIQYAPNLQDRLSHITAPTLIVWGENDRMIPLKYSNRFNGIPNRIMQKLLIVIKKCGHLVSIERPTTFSKIVLRSI